MAYWKVPLHYKDGTTRYTRVNATSASSAKKGVRKIAERQFHDPRAGHDKSQGVPRVGTPVRE
jgi:hypothetical protein